MSDISAFWMFLPFSMTGLGEMLVQPMLQHYAYAEVPDDMRSFMQAVYGFAKGAMPAAFTSIYFQAVRRFTPNVLNEGNLPLVYAINCGIIVLGYIALTIVSDKRCDQCGLAAFQRGQRV